MQDETGLKYRVICEHAWIIKDKRTGRRVFGKLFALVLYLNGSGLPVCFVV